MSLFPRSRFFSTALLALAAASMFLLGLAFQWPMAQAARILTLASDGALIPIGAPGAWHDGMLHLGCALPGGRLFDCGRYRIGARRAGVGMGIAAIQSGGGEFELMLEPGDWSITAKDLRLPFAALGAWLPLVAQMQMGGTVSISGNAQASGKTGLRLRWHGEIGEFDIGEQVILIDGAGGRYSFHFDQSRQGGGASHRGLRLEGSVICEGALVRVASGMASARRGARCRGEVFAISAGTDKKLEDLLTLTGKKIAPGRYRFMVDAQ